jgi:exonuclease VII small subunit|tara:strand:+ start:3677 stop:3820 length:144 start_codon:yes stop_codon:yes gene_type:complete
MEFTKAETRKIKEKFDEIEETVKHIENAEKRLEEIKGVSVHRFKHIR